MTRGRNNDRGKSVGQVSKWNGKMPDVLTVGSGQGMLFNLPVTHSAGK